jgi:hypothetical protein
MSGKNSRSSAKHSFPLFCDYSCAHAGFSDPAAVGACRRDVGVWCGKARRLHPKHARCLFHPSAGGKKAV